MKGYDIMNSFIKTILFYLLSVGVLAGMYVLLWKGIIPSTAFILALACHIVVTLIIRRYQKKIKALVEEDEQISLILDKELDPEKFLKEMTLFSEKYKFPIDMWLRNKISLGSGFNASGRIAEQIELYEKLLLKDNNEKYLPKSLRTVVYSNLSVAYLSNKNLNKALQHYAIFKISRNYKLMRRYRPNAITRVEATIAYLEGRYDEALTSMCNLLHTEQTNYQKMDTHFQLGQIYKEIGDVKSQTEHLQYVAKHGNKLHIANVAREMLVNMDKSSDTGGSNENRKRTDE